MHAPIGPIQLQRGMDWCCVPNPEPERNISWGMSWRGGSCILNSLLKSCIEPRLCPLIPGPFGHGLVVATQVVTMGVVIGP